MLVVLESTGNWKSRLPDKLSAARITVADVGRVHHHRGVLHFALLEETDLAAGGFTDRKVGGIRGATGHARPCRRCAGLALLRAHCASE